jgi:pimeloyl-ACP methyl ester carboxylesterase
MLTYKRFGRGRPLLFVHGFLGGAGVWQGQAVGLKDGFDVVAVDLPGFAGSPIGNAPEKMSGFVAEVIALADHLKIARFSLAGWSFGGMIAQQTALEHPSRIEQLVLAGTAGVGELPRRFETWSQTLDRIRAEGVPATFERTVRTWFVAGEADPFFTSCYSSCQGATEAACMGAIAAMRPWSALDRLADIKQRTLVIVGDRDRSTTPEDSFRLWQGMPQAELCVLPRCAHGAHMERPELFNTIIGGFLSGGHD